MNEPRDYIRAASRLPSIIGLVLFCLAAVVFLAWCGRQASTEMALIAAVKNTGVETGVPGCTAANELPYGTKQIHIAADAWRIIPEARRQQIGFLVWDGKADWTHEPMLICDGKPTDVWYWRCLPGNKCLG